MGQVVAFDDLRVHASDVTGQRSKLTRAPRNATVGEWIQTLIGELPLKRKDDSGQPRVYRAQLERNGRQLNPSELVGEVLEEGDHVVLQPNVDAG